MKIKNLKYIFVFAFGVLFFPVTYAQSVTLEECSNVTGNYSIYTTPHGNVKSESNTNDPTWFYNNESALMWWFEYHPIAIGNNYNVIKSARFDIIKTKDGGAGFSSADSVWHLQNALHLFGCNIDRDCKLGMETSEVFFTCNICGEFGLEEPQSVGSSIICSDGFEVVTQGDGANYCCKKKSCENRGLSGQVEGGSCADGYKPADEPNQDCCVKKTCEEKGFSGDAVGGSCGTGYLPSSDPECCNKAVCSDPNKPVNSTNECDNGYSYNSESACCERQSCSTINEVYVDKPDGGCGDGLTDTDVDFCCQPGSCIDPAIPANGGNCMSGYNPSTQGTLSCCTLVCPGETQYLSGGAGGCQPCETGTIPNISHTKCICDPSKKCCGIQLNMAIPFIGDCIENESDGAGGTGTTVVNSVTAFPILMQGMMKIVMSAILVVSFLLVIVSGFMMTAGAFKSTNFDKGKTMIKNVIISLILLGLSGLILKLINPSFFGG